MEYQVKNIFIEKSCRKCAAREKVREKITKIGISREQKELLR